MKTYGYKLLNNKNIENIIDFSIFQKETNILVQIFCGKRYKTLKFVSDIIIKNIPHAVCIGTTTDGEILNAKVSTLKTVVSISVFKKTTIKTFYVQGKNSFENGFNIAKGLITTNTKLLILFTDGKTTNGEDFLSGVEKFNNKIKICGGMAGDNALFKKTFISSQNNILDNGAVGVSLNSDDLQVNTGYKFDWKAIGLEHTIDVAKGNRVYSIGGMSPKEFYIKYLGENVIPTEFPLIFLRDDVLVACAVLVKHSDGSFSFSGNLKQGDKVRLSFCDTEAIMDNSSNLYNQFLNYNTETFFIYSCMARRRFIKDISKIESVSFASITTTTGFFAYAEFFHKDGHNELLNQTCTAISLSESKSVNISNKTKAKENKSYKNTIQFLTHLVGQSTKDTEESLQKLQKEEKYSKSILNSQRQFIKHTVHETNTFLSIILHNIELYEMENKTNKYFNNILVSLKNLTSIYDDLSYLVKENHISYPKIQIDLVDYLRSRIDFFKAVADKSNLKFNFKSQLKTMPFTFNETKLQRIIDNNITNAIKYTKRKENINIVLKKRNHNYIFLIYSRSYEIHYPENIFKEYYREANSQDGFGLGLNLVQKICNDENINIHLRSTKKITLFKYVFPL